jgi:2-polyprenyl-3-methyl-5-hydroxy-6-metoxy-1,4-benzoquinol methylase
VGADYFANHRRASRFPWSIYHRPLERSLHDFLVQVSTEAALPRVLVIGAGYLHELPEIPGNVRLTAVDIDDRVTTYLSGLEDPRLVRCATIADAAELESMGPFRAVYAKEVIEHILDVETYVGLLVRLIEPGGRIWLSTPNYGDPWLPFLESTVLEAIGRLSGYSRKDIHPTRFSKERLAGLLERAGFTEVRVEKMPLRLSLVGTGRKLKTS